MDIINSSFASPKRQAAPGVLTPTSLTATPKKQQQINHFFKTTPQKLASAAANAPEIEMS